MHPKPPQSPIQPPTPAHRRRSCSALEDQGDELEGRVDASSGPETAVRWRAKEPKESGAESARITRDGAALEGGRGGPSGIGCEIEVTGMVKVLSLRLITARASCAYHLPLDYKCLVGLLLLARRDAYTQKESEEEGPIHILS